MSIKLLGEHLVSAAIIGNTKNVIELIKMGAPLDYVGPQGNALLRAAKAGRSDCALILCESGANPLLFDNWGCSALHYAATKGDVNLVHALLKGGVPVDLPTKTGNIQTPLHLATRWGKFDVAEVLIEAGADVNARSQEGLTPVLLSAKGGHHDLCMHLIVAGGDPEAKDNQGRGIAQYAPNSWRPALSSMVERAKLYRSQKLGEDLDDPCPLNF